MYKDCCFIQNKKINITKELFKPDVNWADAENILNDIRKINVLTASEQRKTWSKIEELNVNYEKPLGAYALDDSLEELCDLITQGIYYEIDQGWKCYGLNKATDSQIDIDEYTMVIKVIDIT